LISGINNNGAIVGSFFQPSFGYSHGFVAYCRNRMVDLNTMLDASGAGWTISDAMGINDSGQIAATAMNSYGTPHAVLLTFNGTLSC
jgi:probable HAF family extracellular repeat protein